MACNPKMMKLQDTPLCNTIPKHTYAEAEVGTITEFYYCCCLMFHYSWHTVFGVMVDLNRTLQRLKNKKTPAEQEDFDYYLQIRNCFDVVLQDPYRNSLLLKLNTLTLHLVLK